MASLVLTVFTSVTDVKMGECFSFSEAFVGVLGFTDFDGDPIWSGKLQGDYLHRSEWKPHKTTERSDL
ncbi:MAG: hypothetical protein ACXW3Z_12685 [Limisphaerales bacterium]